MVGGASDICDALSAIVAAAGGLVQPPQRIETSSATSLNGRDVAFVVHRLSVRLWVRGNISGAATARATFCSENAGVHQQREDDGGIRDRTDFSREYVGFGYRYDRDV